MQSFIQASFLCFALLSTAIAAAQQTLPQKQDPAAIRKTVEHFLQSQTAGLPGQVKITVKHLDARTNLAACAAPEAFLPTGSRVWGRTTVGVRCMEPANWTVYISAMVNVVADYLTTAAPLAQGQIIGPQDIVKARGDLTRLPTGILTDASQAVGRSLTLSLAAGTPLRQDALRAQAAVQQGQTVRLTTTGSGFKISSEAKALTNASEGQIVQTRTMNGQVVSGIAKTGGIVEVTY